MSFSRLTKWILAIDAGDLAAAFSRDAIGHITRDDVIYFVRLWMTEGVPRAFTEKSAYYEAMRDALSSRLGISHKSISLTGSARVGFSLAPDKFLRPYDKESSDLDLFIVSDELFGRISNEIEQWMVIVADLPAPPPRHARYWRGNVEALTKKVRQGYLDTWLIPNIDMCRTSQQVNSSLFHVDRIMSAIEGAPTIKGNGVRIYKDWDSAIRQISYNVFKAIETVQWKIATENSAPKFNEYPCRVENIWLQSSDIPGVASIIDSALLTSNFSGSFHLVLVGVGTEAQQIKIVDLRQRAMKDGPICQFGAQFRPDSRLLVIDPAEQIVAARGTQLPDISPTYWVMRGGEIVPALN